jgi:UDP-N-acetylmuramoyl-L-alanyl-D-glutamate--2,6-diaminopimelate ligase
VTKIARRLDELAVSLSGVALPGQSATVPAVQVSDVCVDSRRVSPGALFVCVPGTKVDGHRFAADALARGAVALVAERPVESGDAPLILVRSARRALAMLASAFYGHPSRRLRVVGVTGTNGKTTTTYLVRAVAEAAGEKAGVLGTLGYDFGSRHEPPATTTPEPTLLQKLFAEMVDGGVRVAAMEVSSHALAMDRVSGTRFAAAVFTNLTRDHLDFHGTEDAYREAKLALFRGVPEPPGDPSPPASAVVNLDDPSSSAFLAAASGPVLTYGRGAACDVRAEREEIAADGSSALVRHPKGRTEVGVRLPGPFNVTNALAAFAAGLSLGYEPDAIARGIAGVEAVPGRMQAVRCGQPFGVIVDYAHTPDALRTVLTSARRLSRGALVCVFGCGGDRDQGKRPEMGRIAVTLADRAVITSDNPRSEDPLAIIAAIQEGAREAGGTYETEPDRRAAIERAIAGAREGDVVLIAGKGHEDYQILGDRTIHFSDVEVAEEFLRGLGYGEAA